MPPAATLCVIGRQMDIQVRQADRQVGRHTGRRTVPQTARQAGRQTYRKAIRLTDRQTACSIYLGSSGVHWCSTLMFLVHPSSLIRFPLLSIPLFSLWWHHEKPTCDITKIQSMGPSWLSGLPRCRPAPKSHNAPILCVCVWQGWVDTPWPQIPTVVEKEPHTHPPTDIYILIGPFETHPPAMHTQGNSSRGGPRWMHFCQLT